ncbi:hypothetical protein F7R01_10270 [Pseudomonas argentinensis]|uniref:Uncharacterized protein n=1 Tax=Phytopseudomonas argentinensis TaxID=289370 RepID=A0A1I3I710_9GAMM|nr:hypothetical protein [Pseudomonas argentinensis]KAB0547877.1 hypothetical protein F7R01_10270 [Pseudomonas argentinensis]SFI43805.1 hypothetical protein SAMN05216602_1472 [Pseudomonas argentinensis]
MMVHRLLRFQENFEALVTALADAAPADQRSDALQQLLSEAQRQVAMLHQAGCVLTAEPIAARERRIARNRRELTALVDQLRVQPVVILSLKTDADLSLAKEHQA